MSDKPPAPLPAAILKFLTPERLMPLGPGSPTPAARGRLSTLTPTALFGGSQVTRPDLAAACVAAIWLHHDFLDEAHAIVQEIDDPVGSYWHAVMHRREGDFSNAKYWLRQAGPLDCLSELAECTHESVASQFPALGERLLTAGEWNPAGFVDLCRAAVGGQVPCATPAAIDALKRLQQAEWQLLLLDCYRRATDGF